MMGIILYLYNDRYKEHKYECGLYLYNDRYNEHYFYDDRDFTDINMMGILPL